MAVTCLRLAMKFCVGAPEHSYHYLLHFMPTELDIRRNGIKHVNNWEERILIMLSHDIGPKLCPSFIDLVMEEHNKVRIQKDLPMFCLLQDDMGPEFSYLNDKAFLEICEQAQKNFVQLCKDGQNKFRDEYKVERLQLAQNVIREWKLA